MSKRNATTIVIPAANKRKKVYAKGAIPYAVSAPNRFWRIKKDLPADQYWKKRYWRRRITGKGSYRLRGRGGYFSNFGKKYGSMAGSWLGGTAGGYVDKILGLGAYQVKSNVFMEGRLPEVVNVPSGGGTVIRFQEYLFDVITSASANTFNIQTFFINPANPQLFPQLAQVAANYEEYEFEGLVFCFKSMSADALNSVNTALGSVMMATQYDTFDSTFTGKTDMLNYEYSNDCRPSESTMHMIECAPRNSAISTKLFTLFGAVPSGADPRLYHLGRFCVATTGFQGTSVNAGEMHVTYQVRLMKPKLFQAMGFAELAFTAQSIAQNATVIYSNAAPLGTAAGLAARIFFPSGTMTPVSITGTVITLPIEFAARQYRIYFEWQGDTAAVIAFPTVTPTNCTFTANIGYPAGDTAKSCVLTGLITATGNGTTPILTLGGAGTLPTNAGTLQQVIIRLYQVPGIL